MSFFIRNNRGSGRVKRKVRLIFSNFKQNISFSCTVRLGFSLYKVIRCCIFFLFLLTLKIKRYICYIKEYIRLIFIIFKYFISLMGYNLHQNNQRKLRKSLYLMMRKVLQVQMKSLPKKI